MILKGRCRAHGSQLARYLFHQKNDMVRVLDIRGTCTSELNKDGLINALKEFDEYGKLTKGEKTIFHLAIAPSDFDRMDASKWQYAVDQAEKALGLEDQPRAVVLHEFDGKEHLHVAWSRVDLETHKLKSDSFTNLKLCNAARDIEIELGLQKLPDIHRGTAQAQAFDRDLKSAQRTSELETDLQKLPDAHRGVAQAQAFDRDLKSAQREVERTRHLDNELKERRKEARKESQRQKEIAKFQQQQSSKPHTELKRIIAVAWHQSETGADFAQRLEEKGLQLVRGNRGVVVMDEHREVFSPARYIEGVKLAEVNDKCKDILRKLPTVDQARDPFKPALSPRKAQKLVRYKLKLEFSNDLRGERKVSYEAEYDPDNS